MKFEFIHQHRYEFAVTRMCVVLEVSTSGYYDWCDRPPSRQEMANRKLLEEIEDIHEQSNETYGSPRIYHELVAQGVMCSENRVARLMRKHDLRAKQSKRRKNTTQSDHDRPIAPNLLDQVFDAEGPNEKWLSDITYVWTEEGWLYLAAVLDLFSRRIVGWAMADNLETDLVLKALNMALITRKPASGLLHHSDRGSQYASCDYQAMLAEHDIQVSMSRTGNCYDNAPLESFFGTLKCERIYFQQYATRAAARSDIFNRHLCRPHRGLLQSLATSLVSGLSQPSSF